MKLEFKNVSKSFSGHPVIENLSATIEFDHVLGLIGPSGGGKSTLLRLIAGLIKADSGSIFVDGQPVPKSDHELRRYRAHIGTVFQAYNLFPHLTALENIVLPLVEVHKLSRKAAVGRANEILDRFLLRSHADKHPAQLSGGQRQRIAIARAVAIAPRFLLFDEPTSALDPEMTAEVLQLILQLREALRPLVLVSHEMNFVRKASDQVALVSNGGIMECSTPENLFGSPSHPETVRFLQPTIDLSGLV